MNWLRRIFIVLMSLAIVVGQFHIESIQHRFEQSFDITFEAPEVYASTWDCPWSFDCSSFVYAGPNDATTISGNFIANADVGVQITWGPWWTFLTTTDWSWDWTVWPIDFSAFPWVTVTVDVKIWESGTCSTGHAPQTFNDTMLWCPWNLAYDWWSVCPSWSHVCTANEYVANRNWIVPTHHYWTASQLRYNWWSAWCWVSETVWSFCGADTPMRVCMPSGATSDYTSSIDPLGNRCNRQTCWIDSPNPNEYFGWCSWNTTAWVLCCWDAGAPISIDACTETESCSYTIPHVCWDGIPSWTEECDDGNTDNTDACLNSCDDASCGDSFVWTGNEECDDGNTDNTDACLNSCDDASCWDSFVWAGNEECDDGNADPNDDCSNICETNYCWDDAPITNPDPWFTVVTSDAWLVDGMTSYPNTKMSICYMENDWTKHVYHDTTDATWAYSFTSPDWWVYQNTRVNVWVMLHDASDDDIDHHSVMMWK